VFVADALNHRIRRIDVNGIITTVAGSPREQRQRRSGRRLRGDGGPAISAQLNQPHAWPSTRTGTYVADSLNNRIRRIDAGNGTINTIAGATPPWATGRPGRHRRPEVPKSMFMTPDESLHLQQRRE